MLIGVWIAYAGANIAIAELNAATRASRLRIHDYRDINHPVWALYYTALCVPSYLFFKDWFYLASVATLHMAILGPAFNIFSKMPSTWYLSPKSKAITDKIMIRMGLKSTELVNFSALFVSITLLVISFYQKH